MKDLPDGYPQDHNYLKIAFNILSPASIKLHLNLAGFPGPDLTGPFAYAELGAGYGVSIAGWAAQYPQAAFHAIDYNDRHAAWCRELAVRAGLDNLHTHGLSIREALALDLPRFDCIVAHGVYSWVDDAVRADIRTFLRTRLKPGGCVYVSYNAMPGFGAFEPMRHLVRHAMRADAAGNRLDGVYAGLALLEKLRKNGAAFFKDSLRAGTRLTQWSAETANFLTAELVTGGHRAYHFSDLAEELDGLLWAGPADMIDHLAAQKLPAPIAELLAGKDPLMAETIRDLFRNTIFRSDLFVSPAAASLSAPQSWTDMPGLRAASFSLGLVRKPLPRNASRHNFEANLTNPIYLLLQSALAAGPLTVENLTGILQLPLPEILHALYVLTALDWVQPGPLTYPSGQAARLRRFNDVLADLSDENSLMPVLSARGGWIKPESQLDHLAIVARLKGEDIAEYLCRFLREDEPTVPSAGDAAFGKSVGKYLARAKKDIGMFLRRHGLEE